MKPELGFIIAHRSYFSGSGDGGAAVVEVEIGAPIESPHSEDEFRCSFRVKSPTSDRVEAVYGIDALQALLLALGYVEAILQTLDSSSSLSLRWLGGESGDFGISIPRFVAGQQPPSTDGK